MVPIIGLGHYITSPTDRQDGFIRQITRDDAGTRAIAYDVYVLGARPLRTDRNLGVVARALFADYRVDVIAMVLLGMGVVRSRQGQTLPPLVFMAAGWGWLGANGWRATADRFELLAEGGVLEFGAAEMCFVVCGTVASFVGVAWSLQVVTRLARAV